MANLNEFRMNEMCRTCLTSVQVHKSMYEASSATETSFAEILMLYTPIKFSANDGLPKQLCDNCTGEINKFRRFLSKCIESDAILRDYLIKTHPAASRFEAVFVKTEVPYGGNDINVERIATDEEDTRHVTTTSLKDPLTVGEMQADRALQLELVNEEEEELAVDTTEIKVKRHKNELPVEDEPTPEHIEEPYSCEACNTSFNQQIYFKAHLRTHTGEEEEEINSGIAEGRKSKRNKSEIQLQNEEESNLTPKYIKKLYSCQKEEREEEEEEEVAKEEREENEEREEEKEEEREEEIQNKQNREESNLIHSCQMCNKSFKQQMNFKKLLRPHTAEEEEVNVKMTHKTNFNRAKSDLKLLNNEKTSLIKKTREGALEKSNLCQLCNESFKQHLRTYTREKQAIYPETQEEITSKHNKVDLPIEKPNAITQVTVAKPHSCHVCHKSFKQQVYLKEHLRIHTGEKPYTCTTCHSSFGRKPNLTLHMRTHTGEKPYACAFCSRTFSDKSALNVHTRTHTGTKPYSCAHCTATFTRNTNLTVHLRTHTGEKPYSCPVCTRSFIQKQNLNDHMLRHTGEKPYACTFCGGTFNQKASLTIHLRTHTGEKPYACHLCNSRFNQKVNLSDHVRTHTGERPFACTECASTFTRKGYLKSHMRYQHSGEKMYACTVCASAFKDKSNLTVHMRMHTGEKPYSCTVCDCAFKKKISLRNHLHKHGPINT